MSTTWSITPWTTRDPKEIPVFERFTDRARRVVTLAREAALQDGHPEVGTEHFLVAMLAEGEGIAGQTLEIPVTAPDSPAVAAARTEARLRRLAGDATAADALDGLLAELAALPEWSCPACGATTRARMADHTPPTEGSAP